MLKLESIYAVQDTRVVPIPWISGVTFTIARIGNRKYQRHLKEWQKKNPVIRTLLGASVKAAVLGASKRQSIDQNDPSAMRKMDQIQADIYDDALRAAAEKLDTDSIDLDDMTDDAGIVHILVGWDGMTDENGALAPWSEDAVLQLLQSTVPLPVGSPYGPTKRGESVTLGQAVKAFVLKESAEMEILRDQQVEIAAGESVASPDGASDAGRS
jgi:hypothetical protein